MISTKYFIAVIAVSCIALTLAAELPAGRKLKCADELHLNACYLENTDSKGEKTVYVEGCPKGKFCRQTQLKVSDDGFTTSDNLGICVKPLKIGDEGDKCEVDAECKWGHCTDNKCKAVADGGSCTDDDECSGISYCKINDKGVGACTKLEAKGASCTDSYQCEWGSVCNLEKCVEMYSLDNGEAADNGEACKGGEIKKSETKNKKVCAFYKYNDDKSCKGITPSCFYTVTTGLQGDTDKTDQDYKCDQDKDGKWVCPKIESDQEFQDYVKIYKETLEDMDDEDKARITNERTLNDKKVAEAWNKYWYAVQINGADECIEDFYLQLNLSSSSLKFTLLSLVSLFLIIA